MGEVHAACHWGGGGSVVVVVDDAGADVDDDRSAWGAAPTAEETVGPATAAIATATRAANRSRGRRRRRRPVMERAGDTPKGSTDGTDRRSRDVAEPADTV